jgi:hypothetical protein
LVEQSLAIILLTTPDMEGGGMPFGDAGEPLFGLLDRLQQELDEPQRRTARTTALRAASSGR